MENAIEVRNLNQSAFLTVPTANGWRRYRKILGCMSNKLSVFVRRFSLGRASDLSYEEWMRLEYRNHFADRIGERMNPFCLR